MQESKPLVAAACITLVPAACAHPAAPVAAEVKVAEAAAAPSVLGVKPGVVDGATGRKLAEAGVFVLDVRTPREFEAGHVPGARNIPVDELAARASEVGPPATPVLVYCRSGHRSGIARETLQRLGFTTVYDLRTFSAWEQSAQ
jgi:phage shock protein E